MGSSSFNEASSEKPRAIEATLVSIFGPETHMDSPFYFCTLELDSGERVQASISDWNDSLKIGERVCGQPSSIDVFTGHKHIDRLERVALPALPSASLLNRLGRIIKAKFGS